MPLVKSPHFAWINARPPASPPPCRGRGALANSHPLSGEGWGGGECRWSNPRTSHGSTRDLQPLLPPAGGGERSPTPIPFQGRDGVGVNAAGQIPALRMDQRATSSLSSPLQGEGSARQLPSPFRGGMGWG